MKVIPPIAFKSSPLIHKSALGAEFSVDWVYEKETFSEYFSNGWNRALAFPAYRGEFSRWDSFFVSHKSVFF